MIHAMLPLARGNDPITSFQAADSAKAFIRTHEKEIVFVLSHAGPMGVDRMGQMLCLTGHAVGKRMKALHERGEVALTGRTVKSDAGRNQREWMVAA
jgi:predicted ArsR family transcriptional regulator